MIKLDTGNVLLKPSHRRRLMTSLRRALRLGERLGNFVLTITMQKIGRLYELRATVRASAADFDCRCRQHSWQNALRDLSRTLAVRLHDSCIRRAAMM